MKSKQSRNLIIMAMSSLTLINAVVPSYATNPITNEVSAVTPETISEEVEVIEEEIVTLVLSTAKVLNTEELASLEVPETLESIPVYSEANSQSELIGNIELGTDVVIYAEYEGFSEIIFKEQICYINSKYLAFTDEENLEDLPQLIEVEEVVEVVEEETIGLTPLEPIAIEYVVPLMDSDNIEKAKEEPINIADLVVEEYVVPLMESESSSAPAETTESTTETQTQAVDIVDVINGGSTSASSQYAVVNASTGLNLRASASTSSTILAKLSNGTVADVIEVVSGWAKVKVNGTTGYVSLDYVNLTNTKPAVSVSTTSSSSSSVSSSSSSKATEIINFAKKYIGTRYVYGGTSLTSGVDCSGFTYSVFKNFGINLNRTSRDQYSNGVSVSKANLQAGDLVFFNTGGNTSISHVGIYIGNNQYIHSTDGSGNGVCIASLNSAYAQRTYYGARRVI